MRSIFTASLAALTAAAVMAGPAQAELNAINRAISGDLSSLKDTAIAKRAEECSLADLLSYRGFVESVWEWPMSTQVTGLVFFGLLPPLSWVMAASVENLLYG